MKEYLNGLDCIKRPLFIPLIVLTLLSTYGECESSNGNNEPDTSTPIKHLVVIYMENASFDLIFGTYPDALNPPGEPEFIPPPERRA